MQTSDFEHSLNIDYNFKNINQVDQVLDTNYIEKTTPIFPKHQKLLKAKSHQKFQNIANNNAQQRPQ